MRAKIHGIQIELRNPTIMTRMVVRRATPSTYSLEHSVVWRVLRNAISPDLQNRRVLFSKASACAINSPLPETGGSHALFGAGCWDSRAFRGRGSGLGIAGGR